MSELYDKIEQYLQGDLNKEERARFEMEMQNDPELAKDVLLFRQVKTSISHQLQIQPEVDPLKKSLSEIGLKYFHEVDPDHKKGRFAFFRLLSVKVAVAASVLILLLWRPWQSSLYDQFFTPPVASFTVMGEPEGINPVQLQTAFNDQRYADALPLMEAYLKIHPEDTEMSLLKGVCLMETDRLEEARAVLEPIFEGQSIFKYKGAWYLALSYLKQSNRKKCAQYLHSILDNQDAEPLWKDAQKLLRKLE